MMSEIKPAPPPPGWRFGVGLALFVISLLTPLGIPLVALLSLPLAWKAAISGLLMVGLPEVFALLAVAVLGKAGFTYLKEKFWAMFKKYALPQEVSRLRYRLGLCLFLTPLLLGWLASYFSYLIPGYGEHQIAYNLIGDLIWLSSLLVLGGDFWDKVRALFIHRAKAVFPS